MKDAVADYQTLVLCLRIEPENGAPVQLTHFPRDLPMSNGEVYLSGSGYDFTGYAAESNLAPSLVDLEGILGVAGITRDTIASGVFDGARAYLFATTWDNPVEDEEPIVASILGKTTLEDDRYRIEEMALTDLLNQSVGQTYTPGCTKTFGGQEYAGCKVDLGPLTVTGTITSVTDSLTFRDSARTEDADYFGAGTVRFTSGANAALGVKKIKQYDADGTIHLFEPFHYTVETGDAYELIPGCRKRLEDCRDKWDNVANFGGDPFMPASSSYMQVGSK